MPVICDVDVTAFGTVQGGMTAALAEPKHVAADNNANSESTLVRISSTFRLIHSLLVQRLESSVIRASSQPHELQGPAP
jgi:hypothetical protein